MEIGTSRKRYKFFLPGEGPIDQATRGQVKTNVLKVVEFVFFGWSFLAYGRRRWTASDIAVSQIPILAVVHGPLWDTRSVPPWLGLQGNPTSGEKSATPACGDAPGASAPRRDVGCDKVDERASVLNPSDVALKQWVAATASCVRKADAWFSSRPLADMIAIRTVMAMFV